MILDDGGVLPASANLLADIVGRNHPLYAPARYLAAIAAGSSRAIMEAVHSGFLHHGEALDEAHAWSELNCHRAAEIRRWVDTQGALANAGATLAIPHPDGGFVDARAALRMWAEEDRLFTTRIIGGEYNGAFEVDGVSGIKRKDRE